MHATPNPWRKWWTLAPDVHFYNHGSFGACPEPLLEQQQVWRARLEREPVRFMVDELPEAMHEARRVFAAFLRCHANDLAVVANATTAVNTVLRAIRWQAGDQILVTNHGYPACNAAAAQVAREVGAEVVVAAVPFPLQQPEQVVSAVLNRVTDRTRLAILDHVTSPTAVVFPIESLVASLTAQGIEVLVDGAHAPGMLPLNLAALKPTYYTGNCHKWLCAPKSSAFLYVAPDKQQDFHPLVLSHGLLEQDPLVSPFRAEFDWMGTVDPTPFLTAAQAIQYFATTVPGGWKFIYSRNRLLAQELQQALCNTLQQELPVPPTMLGCMCTVPIPAAWLPMHPMAGQQWSRERYVEQRIEIPCFVNPTEPGWLLRASCPLYLTLDDFVPLLAWLTQAIKSQ